MHRPETMRSVRVKQNPFEPQRTRSGDIWDWWFYVSLIGTTAFTLGEGHEPDGH